VFTSEARTGSSNRAATWRVVILSYLILMVFGPIQTSAVHGDPARVRQLSTQPLSWDEDREQQADQRDDEQCAGSQRVRNATRHRGRDENATGQRRADDPRFETRRDRPEMSP
jgi:hypothetical protein